MDPAACLTIAIDPTADPLDRLNARRDYAAWIERGGAPTDVRVWSDRVFGVPAVLAVTKIGTKRLHGTFHAQLCAWRGSVPFSRLVDA